METFLSSCMLNKYMMRENPHLMSWNEGKDTSNCRGVGLSKELDMHAKGKLVVNTNSITCTKNTNQKSKHMELHIFITNHKTSSKILIPKLFVYNYTDLLRLKAYTIKNGSRDWWSLLYIHVIKHVYSLLNIICLNQYFQ